MFSPDVVSSANATVSICFLSKRLINIFSKGVFDIEYIAIVNGCPCVVPSLNNIYFPPTINKEAGTQ